MSQSVEPAGAAVRPEPSGTDRLPDRAPDGERRPVPEASARVTPLRAPRVGGVQRPWRAGILVLLGALVIGGIAASFQPSLLALPDVTLGGTIVGLVLATLGLLIIAQPRSSMVLGAFAIVCAIVAFPVALGGLVVGSLLAIAGGALAVGWEPAPPGTVLRWQRAGFLARLAALLVDAAIVAVPVVVLAATVLNDAMSSSTVVTLAVEGGLWLLLAVVSARLGASPGKLLLRLRISRAGGLGAPDMRHAVLREVIRLLELVLLLRLLITFSGVLALRPLAFGVPDVLRSVPVGPVLMVLLVLALAVAAQRVRFPHDLAAGTEVLRGRLVVPDRPWGRAQDPSEPPPGDPPAVRALPAGARAIGAGDP